MLRLQDFSFLYRHFVLFGHVSHVRTTVQRGSLPLASPSLLDIRMYIMWNKSPPFLDGLHDHFCLAAHNSLYSSPFFLDMENGLTSLPIVNLKVQEMCFNPFFQFSCWISFICLLGENAPLLRLGSSFSSSTWPDE